ncbi:MAG: hypothetical protein U5K81_15055 [Trueperaceae bacterium]|nr:hypothetical protein [Trueperaceae bacterium]
MRVIDSGSDRNALGDQLTLLGGRFVGQYEGFVANLHSAGVGLEVWWSRHGQKLGYARIDRVYLDAYKEAVSLAAEEHAEVIEIEGRLDAWHRGRRTFGIMDDDDNWFAGKLADSMDVDRIEVGARCVAALRMITRVNSLTLDESTEYRLLNIQVLEA